MVCGLDIPYTTRPGLSAGLKLRARQANQPCLTTVITDFWVSLPKNPVTLRRELGYEETR